MNRTISSSPPSTAVETVSETTGKIDLRETSPDDGPKVTVELIREVIGGQTPSPSIPSLTLSPSPLPTPNCSYIEPITIEHSNSINDQEGSPPSSGPSQPYARSAPVTRLVHQLDRPILGPLLVALLNILLCLSFLGPTLFVVLVLLPVFAALNCAISACLNKQRRCSTLLSGPESFWHTRRTVSQCVLTLDAGLGLAEVRNLVRTRVLDAQNESGRKLFPKFTQKLLSIRSGHAWMTDEDFDITQHVFSADPPPPGEAMGTSTREELLRCAGRLASQEFPKDRSPWQMHVFGKVDGAGDEVGSEVRGTAILFRCDPCLCDGVTLMRIFNRRLAERPSPCERKKLFGPVDEVFNLIRAVCAGFLSIIKTILTYEDYNPLHGPKMSRQRQVTCSEPIPLAKVLRVTDVTRSHLNDVLLAVLSGTLRDYLVQHGVGNPYDLTATLFVSMQKTRIYHGTPSSVSFSVPAQTDIPEAGHTSPTEEGLAQNKPGILGHGSVEDSGTPGTHRRLADCSSANGSGLVQGSTAETRREKGVSHARLQSAQVSSNTTTGWVTSKVKLSLVNVALPVNTEGAVPQLWEVRQRMNEVRSSVDHVVFYYCQTIFWHLLPTCLRERLWRLYYGQSTLLISSLIGPEDAVSLADTQVDDVTYWAPALEDVSLAVSFVTYAGQLRLSLSTDTGVIPDPDTIASLFVYKMDVLSQLLANRRIPGERTLRLMRRRTSMLEPNATEIRNRIDDVERQLKDLESGYGQKDTGSPGGGGGGPGGREVSTAAEAAEDAIIADRVANLRVEFQDMLQDLRRRLSEIHSEVSSYESDDDVDDDEEEDGELRRPSRLHSFSGVSRGSFLSVLSSSTSCLVQAVSPTRLQDHLPTTITVVAPGCSTAAAPPGEALSQLSKRRHLSDQMMDPAGDRRRESCKSQVSVRMEQGQHPD